MQGVAAPGYRCIDREVFDFGVAQHPPSDNPLGVELVACDAVVTGEGGGVRVADPHPRFAEAVHGFNFAAAGILEGAVRHPGCNIDGDGAVHLFTIAVDGLVVGYFNRNGLPVLAGAPQTREVL